MRNIYLTDGTAKDINQQVAKVLRGLGNPEPPLDLDAVFTLLKLDPQYYTKSDDGVVRETISRVKVGAKLVFQDPTRIWDAIKKLDLKALYIPAQRRVLIDGNLHVMKKRWNGGHEVGHSILEWHEDYTWGDTQYTLTPTWHEQIEAEANYAAGRLLFLQERFEERVKGARHTLKGLQELSKAFGNSWTSTVYRTVEALDTPAFAVIGTHPLVDGEERFRYFVASVPFAQHFTRVDESRISEIFPTYCRYTKRGPLGAGEFTLEDDRGEVHSFMIESFAIPQGDVFTLAQCIGKPSSILSIGASS